MAVVLSVVNWNATILYDGLSLGAKQADEFHDDIHPDIRYAVSYFRDVARHRHVIDERFQTV